MESLRRRALALALALGGCTAPPTARTLRAPPDAAVACDAPWLGHSLPHHTLSHASDTDAAAVEQLHAIGRWYASQFATLLDKLAAVREHDGSLLDNTVVLWCSDVSTGNTHERRDMPYVLAGRCGGALSPGRRVGFDGAPHNELLLAIAHAMDVPIDTFGNPDYCRAPLSGLAG